MYNAILNNPGVFYHATYAKRVHQIKEEGLVIGKKSNWKGMNCQNGIYLTSSIDGVDGLDYAISFCEVADNVPQSVYDSGIVVLMIPQIALDLNLLEHDDNINSKTYWWATFCYKANIYPWHIRLLVNPDKFDREKDVPFIRLEDCKRVTDKYRFD